MTDEKRDDMAMMMEGAADQVNGELQPDWEGIARFKTEARSRRKAGTFSTDWAVMELHKLVPEHRDDVFDRVMREVTSRS